MRVVAFSCAHLATEETQLELQERLLDYRPVQALMRRLLESPPDVVVNLGDFVEPVYDGDRCDLVVERLLPDYIALEQVTKVVRLSGNHDDNDRERPYTFEADGLTYEHGHRFIGKRPGGRDDYTFELRRAVKGLKIVHGHTHAPSGPWPLDVGSITFTGTYGQVTDGDAAEIVKIGEVP